MAKFVESSRPKDPRSKPPKKSVPFDLPIPNMEGEVHRQVSPARSEGGSRSRASSSGGSLFDESEDESDDLLPRWPGFYPITGVTSEIIAKIDKNPTLSRYRLSEQEGRSANRYGFSTRAGKFFSYDKAMVAQNDANEYFVVFLESSARAIRATGGLDDFDEINASKSKEVPLSRKFHQVKAFAKWIQFTPEQWETRTSEEGRQTVTLNGSEELLSQASKATKMSELSNSQKLTWSLDSKEEEGEVLDLE